MMKLISKFIRRFFRRWYKTDRGKWHIGTYEFSLKRKFKPACHPGAMWKIAGSKRRTPPEGEMVCKICAKLKDE